MEVSLVPAWSSLLNLWLQYDHLQDSTIKYQPYSPSIVPYSKENDVGSCSGLYIRSPRNAD